MLRRNRSDDTPTGGVDEERIRAEERANYEQELRTLEEDRRGRTDGAGADSGRGDGEDRATDRDRDGHPVDGGHAADDRMIDRDRDGRDDRTEQLAPSTAGDDRDRMIDRDRDRDGRDDRTEQLAPPVAGGDADRDRDGRDDRTAHDTPAGGYVAQDRDRDGIADRDQDERIEVVRKRSFSLGQLLTIAAGGALLALGIVALVRTGIDTPLSEPVESVLGWDHTPLLGIIEVAAGGLLVLLSLRPGGRWFVAVIGLALVVGGVAVLGELDWTVDELGTEQVYGWVPIVVGGVALLASLLTPRRYQRVTGIPADRF